MAMALNGPLMGSTLRRDILAITNRQAIDGAIQNTAELAKAWLEIVIQYTSRVSKFLTKLGDGAIIN